MGFEEAVKIPRKRLWKVSALAATAVAALNGWAFILPITITNPLSTTLTFGKFSATGGGTVTVSPAGARSAGGGVVLLSSAVGSAAQFLVSGDPNATYLVTLPAAGAVVLAGPGQSMGVNFTSNPTSTGNLSLAGFQTLQVGGTLSVGGNQAPGSYTGSFSVLVEYN